MSGNGIAGQLAFVLSAFIGVYRRLECLFHLAKLCVSVDVRIRFSCRARAELRRIERGMAMRILIALIRFA
jgi:hypothetical protein